MTDFGRSNGPLDFKLCVICQEKSTANLVENPTSHQKLLEAIEERSKYEDINSKTLWLVLKDLPLEELKEKAKTVQKTLEGVYFTSLLLLLLCLALLWSTRCG